MKPTANIPVHLPRRLTISFPIWGLFDTGSGAYHDLDAFVKGHVERGFNCIRLEGGAGLTHDLSGRLRGPIRILAPYGDYTINRQAFVFGGEGYCDVMARLIGLCEACRKYDVYLILSSWYFLHTYWYMDNELNAELMAVRSEDVFMTFARLLHYTLAELEARGLSDRIAMAEIFNEVPAIPGFLAELKHEDVSHIDFTARHAEALAWLRGQHPGLLFAVDSDNLSDAEVARIPATLQAFNGHNYFLWGVYGGTLEQGESVRSDLFMGRYTRQDMIDSRRGLLPLPESSAGWYDRMARCNDLDRTRLPALEAHLEARLAERRQEYIDRLDAFCEGYRKVMARFPGIPIVCGEGVTYCSAKEALWEERSDAYWDMVRLAMRRYKALGLWGTVVKTCCGPEDPCWELCRDRLKELNALFLADDD